MAISALVMSVSLAEAQDRIQVGTLECSLSSSVGLIVGSQRNVNCNFKPNNGPPEMYTGTMTKIGLDIGVTSATAIIWTVFTGTNRYSGMLAGTYTGAQAEATVGAGLGANALVGGSNRSVALQPFSVQGQLGLNVAAGIGQLELHPVQQ
jgi:hypothetical protein